MKFASIDIGSNAVRLLFCNVIQDNNRFAYKKAELLRVPIRLGEDSFLRGRISKAKTEKLISAMKAFKNLIEVYDAIDYRACATAAMREAANSPEIIKRIKLEAGIKVELIDGKTEADIIYSNHVEEKLDKNGSYLYIDVGGGSTELTLFFKGKNVASQSFNIGTIRMLYNKVKKDYWIFFKEWVRENTAGRGEIIAIGSGGNINKLYKMSENRGGKPLSFKKLKSLADKIESYSVDERIQILGLNPDRADVIVPASRIILSVMKHGKINHMLVPEIGLSDGIVHGLFEKWRKENRKRALFQ